jgi:UDP-N-acetyl-D-glucosamine dehydrogenase
MPAYVVERIADALNTVKKPLNGSTIHLFGVAYKKNVGDMRESPALDILEVLLKRGAVVTYTDPWVASLQHGSHTFESIAEEAALKEKPDCVVICTDHADFDYDRLVGAAALIVDTRNALKGRTEKSIFRL